MTSLIGVASVPIIGAVNLLVVLVTRWTTARLLGARRIRFVPFLRKSDSVRIAVHKQALSLAAVLAAAYLVPCTLFAGAVLAGGRHATPEEIRTRVDVVPGKPAEAAGVRDGDRVVAVAGAPVKTWTELQGAIRARPGQTVAVVVERNDARLTLAVDVPREARIGVTPSGERVPVGPVEALVLGLTLPARVAYMQVDTLVHGVTGGMEGELVGPVAMARAVERTEPDLATWLQFAGLYDVSYGMPVAFVLAVVWRVRREASP